MAALAALRSRRGLARASAAFSTWTPSAWTSAAQASASTARRPSARASARPRICGALHGDRSLRRSFYRIVSSEKGGKDRHLTIPLLFRGSPPFLADGRFQDPGAGLRVHGHRRARGRGFRPGHRAPPAARRAPAARHVLPGAGVHGTADRMHVTDLDAEAFVYGAQLSSATLSAGR